MYIHQVVIDANRINARGGIDAMNRLETYHRFGLIELLRTSTLPVEFLKAPPQQEKAKGYDIIAGSGHMYLTDGPVADASPGTPIRRSRFSEIQSIIFGEGAFSSDEIRVRAQRDVLHIDQAWQNGVDYFVTKDKALLVAAASLATAGITLRVCTAEECATNVGSFFAERYGSSDASELGKIIGEEGPIFIGSNSAKQIAFKDGATGDALFTIIAEGQNISIEGTIRGADGDTLVTITPEEPFSFKRPGARITVVSGTSPLLVGHTFCKSVTVSHDGRSLFAGRMLRSGRFLLYDALIYNQAGSIVVRVTRDVLELHGATF